MTVQFSTDITYEAIQQYVLRELKEPTTGSEAIPLDWVKDAINDVYSSAFNDQRMKQSARENDVSFTLANDTTLVSDTASGAVTLVLADTTTFLAAGKVLMASDIISYTGNVIATGTLTGVTGLSTNQVAGTVVRQMYPLATIAATIQEEQIQYLDINGLPQQYLTYDNLITQINFTPNTYTVYKGHLLFSKQATLASSTPAKVLMVYTEKVVPLSSGTDKPTLIPNSWRIPLLAYGTCMKLAAADSFRTSWDFWKSEYDKALSQYIAFKNNRVKDVQNRRRPSVWNSYSMYK
jgi:hypothetical protein